MVIKSKCALSIKKYRANTSANKILIEGLAGNPRTFLSYFHCEIGINNVNLPPLIQLRYITVFLYNYNWVYGK